MAGNTKNILSIRSTYTPESYVLAHPILWTIKAVQEIQGMVFKWK
ncbi:MULTISPECIES: hypothetical protein [unclassified Eikenella]|nr:MULTISPECIES: hypothetical protein [unclassified Eikenella]